ncbi:hypothetical protein QOZ91_000182 [Clostridium sardiniense]|nr:hypothetical protein [Clostridium sardiniense]
MNKEINIFKVSNYDKFKCTADRCKFTCWKDGVLV